MRVAEVKVLAVRELECEEKVESERKALAVWQALVETASWYDPDKEACVALLLNNKHQVTAAHLVSLGTLDGAVVHAREVFRPAIVAAAKAVLLMHNHPSGDPTPSAEDLEMTRAMAAAGKLLDMPVLDHIVVGDRGRHYSFRAHHPEVFA